MGKKVISFSLYGKHPKYTLGAVANARHANRAYPGWICRFYVADDVPKVIVSRLHAHGAEVVNMGQRFGHEAMFWRLFAGFEPENEIVIFRDADSRFTKCELVMVNDWLASGKKFHVMRWDYLPDVSVMGGLWGLRGHISELREPVKKCLKAKNFWVRFADERFLNKNLTPKMKGKVYVNELYSLKSRRCFIVETIHPFPSFAYTKRGKYLNMPMPVGMETPSRRVFMAFSIYKNTPFYEFFLAKFISNIENQDLFCLGKIPKRNQNFTARFYVADDIRPDLIERLRRLGQVVLRSAKTVHKDDPQYWKLSILSERELGMVMMVGFWDIFFLARTAQRLDFRELMPFHRVLESTRIKFRTRMLHPLSVCGPDIPVANIDSLVAQRDPNESYQKFIRSTVSPRISNVRMVVRLEGRYSQSPDSFIKHRLKKSLPPSVHAKLNGLRKHLKINVFSLKS